MKYLITGANGQLGKCLTDRMKKNDDIQYLSLSSAELDITDQNSVEKVIADFKPDVVLNAAAYTAVDKAESDQEAAEAVNVNGPQYLAEACAKQGAWLMHVSTDYVFDGTASQAYVETDVVSPVSVYGDTKLRGEQAVLNGNANTLVVRTAWVFSEYGNNFVKTMLRLAKERPALAVVNDQVGCPTYAGDIADCLMELAPKALNGEVEKGIYHYAGDIAVSWWSFAREIFSLAVATGVLENAPELKGISSEEFPTPVTRPEFSVLECAKLVKYGISPSDWRTALRNIIS